ncbi:MAG: CPBP family intramembrane metalloprotease, partial [Actinomycetota bacterium]|nr:CPBP family intramembrane metalloprotease [Actinomycetota bacterium]
PDPSRPPAWPWWYAPAGFLAAAGLILALGIFVGGGGALAGVDLDDPPPAFNIVALFAQDVALVAAALLVAGFTARPRAWHFGLRPVRLWPAAGYAAAGLAVFYAFTALYSAAVHPEGKQSVAEDLGVNRGTVALIVGAIVVIVVAPIAEEFFFRGFFYRALRNGTVGWLGARGGVLLAALIDGALFGVIHFEGGDTLSLLPLLAVLGAIFCLVYEYTGTLFATIALHAINNSVAYTAVADDGVAVALPLGAAMIAACVLAPRLIGDRRGEGLPREAAAAP